MLEGFGVSMNNTDRLAREVEDSYIRNRMEGTRRASEKRSAGRFIINLLTVRPIRRGGNL